MGIAGLFVQCDETGGGPVHAPYLIRGTPNLEGPGHTTEITRFQSHA